MTCKWLHAFNLYIYTIYMLLSALACTCMYLIYIYKNYMQVPTTYIAYYIVANSFPCDLTRDFMPPFISYHLKDLTPLNRI